MLMSVGLGHTTAVRMQAAQTLLVVSRVLAMKDILETELGVMVNKHYHNYFYPIAYSLNFILYLNGTFS